MVHVASRPVNSIERRYGRTWFSSSADHDIAGGGGGTAAGTVLVALHPEQAETKAALATYLAAIADGDAKSDGIKLGEAVAARILQARANDGANAADATGRRPGPGFMCRHPITVASYWPDVHRYALTKPSQFRPQPPVLARQARNGRRFQ